MTHPDEPPRPPEPGTDAPRHSEPTRTDDGVDTGNVGDAARGREMAEMVGRIATSHSALKTRLQRIENRQEHLHRLVDELEQLLRNLAARSAEQNPSESDTTPTDLAAAETDLDTDQHDTQDSQPQDDTQDDDVDTGDVESGLDMRRLVAWVDDNIAQLIERKVPQTGGAPSWCRSWWLHPEAIARFEALRRVWAEAVTDSVGTAMANYFQHLDHQLGVLTTDIGPFSRCKNGAHAATDDVPSLLLGQHWPDEDYFRKFDTDRSP